MTKAVTTNSNDEICDYKTLMTKAVITKWQKLWWQKLT